ncbi:hypothetical protein CTA2_270 [Colletotrichum tanaceti]|uniref:Uncharacterized protein n=1 Tax=Colletotrichum tanaceti TaxID=1306861 RepID=A0A4U6XU79_9PEZI|nr:hypothetical protein CTA2_270 [Colletotrichum tanaceti]TKW59468.1 hypothetical protein CTA1_11486 [Colletotrichum tanaceti]
MYRTFLRSSFSSSRNLPVARLYHRQISYFSTSRHAPVTSLYHRQIPDLSAKRGCFLFNFHCRQSSTKRVTVPDEWIIPIADPRTEKWDVEISQEDADKLLNGLSVPDMDYRWLCYSDGPDQTGTIVVHFCRSWTGREFIRLKIMCQSHPTAATNDKTNRITEITWLPSRHDPSKVPFDMRPKEMAIEFCRGMLKCKLENVA